MAREVRIVLDDSDHERLKQKKGKLTWKEYLLSK